MDVLVRKYLPDDRPCGIGRYVDPVSFSTQHDIGIGQGLQQVFTNRVKAFDSIITGASQGRGYCSRVALSRIPDKVPASVQRNVRETGDPSIDGQRTGTGGV